MVQAGKRRSDPETSTRQMRQAPTDIEQVQINYEDIASGWFPGEPIPEGAPIKADKLVHKVGLATSVTEASKKRAAGSVKIDDIVVRDPIYRFGNSNFPKTVILHLGRQIKRVHMRGPLAP